MMRRQHDGKLDGALSAAGASAPPPASASGESDLLEVFRTAEVAEDFRTAEEAESAELAESLLALLSSSTVVPKPAPTRTATSTSAQLGDDARARAASRPPRTPLTALAAHTARAELQPKISGGKSMVLRSNRPSRRSLKTRRAATTKRLSRSGAGASGPGSLAPGAGVGEHSLRGLESRSARARAVNRGPCAAAGQDASIR